MPSFPAKLKMLAILAKTLEKQKLNFSCSALFNTKTRVSPKYLANDCRMLCAGSNFLNNADATLTKIILFGNSK